MRSDTNAGPRPFPRSSTILTIAFARPLNCGRHTFVRIDRSRGTGITTNYHRNHYALLGMQENRRVATRYNINHSLTIPLKIVTPATATICIEVNQLHEIINERNHNIVE